jgi:hypothetical protein
MFNHWFRHSGFLAQACFEKAYGAEAAWVAF